MREEYFPPRILPTFNSAVQFVLSIIPSWRYIAIVEIKNLIRTSQWLNHSNTALRPSLLPLKVRSDDVVILYGSELNSLKLHLMILICSDTIFLSFNTHADPVYSDGDDQNEDEEIETISAKRSSKKGSKRSTRKKGSDKSNADSEPSSVIYLGHLPVGFEEREISVFLNQFGNVLRCRVSRSKKTGRSRGYAFVEFVDHEVANIVAETMSGYFLLEKRLVCHIVPNDQVHDLMFAKAKRIATKADLHKKARLEVNKQRSADALKGITAKLVKREDMKRKKLAALGIDYDFPGYAAGAQSTDDDVEPSSSSKRRRTMSSEDNDEEQADLETKTPKSSKKKKKTTKASKVGNEKENDTNAPKKSKEKEEKTDKFSPRVTRSKKSKKTPNK